ncbi:MAG: EamA family transporter, partial [Candidatus Limnocylindria bacterium]
SYGGIALTLAGLAVFAGVAPTGALDPLAVGAIGASSLAFAGWLVLGRHFVRGAVPASGLTAASMLVGTLPLLPVAALVERPPALDVPVIAIIAWLSVVNTAVAFTVWAESQRGLRAYESNVLTSVVVVEASVLAFFVLGEPLGPPQWLGLATVVAGVTLTQLPRRTVTPALPEGAEAA